MLENAVLKSAAKKLNIAAAAAAAATTAAAAADADVGGGSCIGDNDIDSGLVLKQLLLGDFDLNTSSLSNRLRAVAPSAHSVQKGISSPNYNPKPLIIHPRQVLNCSIFPPHYCRLLVML